MIKTISKGTVFWYKSKGKKYAAIVLDEIGNDGYFFVLISEELDQVNTVNSIMESPAYTAAWFSDVEMLPFWRIHVVAEGFSFENFNGRAGGLFSEKTVAIYNYGQSKTWKHEWCQLSFHSRKMKEQISADSYNKCIEKR